MGLEKQTLPNAQRARMYMKNVAMSVMRAEKHCVVLAASHEGSMQMKKQWADEDFSFGLSITTLSSWLQDRWELFGDGRRIVSTIERKLLMDKALRKAQEEGLVYELARTPGTIKLLAAMAREDLSWLIEGARTKQSVGALTQAETETLIVLRLYADLLEDYCICEPVQAMEMLRDRDYAASVFIVEDRREFTRAEAAFFLSLAESTEVYIIRDGMTLSAKEQGRAQELIDLQHCLFEPDPNNPLEPSGSVRFLLPAGNYAADLLIARSAVELTKMGDNRIAVSTKEPGTLFEHIADYLTSHGISISYGAMKRFEQSDFGKMWITLFRFLFGPRGSSFQLSDVLLSRFSDVPQWKAYELDLRWRADRASTKEDYIRDVSAASPLFAHVFKCLCGEKWINALDVFESFGKERIGWTKAYRVEQQKAISSARSFFEVIIELKSDPIEALPQLAEHELMLSAYIQGEALSSQVDIMSLEALAEAEACSYDAVILCDLDAATYPVRDAQDAKTRLFTKLGNNFPNNALERARTCFFKVLSVPMKHLICERTLNTVEANKNYPAVMLEELLDCYRHDLLAFSEIDRASGMPKMLLPFVERAGEDMLYQNLVVLDEDQEIDSKIGLCSHGVLHDESKDRVVLSHQGKAQTDINTLLLSPSAIESYLECPYKWFALRRLRLESLDAGFGPLEMGIFSHELLKEFYQRFQELGNRRVLPENLLSAKELLAGIFDKQVALQKGKKSKDRPLIAITKLEEVEVDSLKKSLLAYLERDAVLLPGFAPLYFEQAFGQKMDFKFAGCLLHGTIDRIDVNDKGQAVVIDYKGAVDVEYAFTTTSELPWASEDSEVNRLVLPNKVQTLLYAQAARKELGLEVVGGLYLSYGKKAVAGAYDPHVLGPSEIPGIRPELNEAVSAKATDFASVLDEFEPKLKSALNCLKKGHIRPYPRGKDPCGYCPVTTCELRR